MTELKAPLQDSLSVKDLSALVTNPVWIQWFNNILRYTIPALGSANQKLFVNSAGTESEWASGLKVGSFTRAMDAANGDVSYTGVGFNPSVLVFIGWVSTASASIGFSDGSSSGHVIVGTGGSGVLYWGDGTRVITLAEVAGSKDQSAVLKTRDTDGFTLTWTKLGSTASATGYGYYFALR